MHEIYLLIYISYILFLEGLYSKRIILERTCDCFYRNVDSVIFWNSIATKSDDTICPSSKYILNLQFIRTNLESVYWRRYRFLLRFRVGTFKILFTAVCSSADIATEFVDFIFVDAFAFWMYSKIKRVGKSKNE